MSEIFYLLSQVKLIDGTSCNQLNTEIVGAQIDILCISYWSFNNICRCNQLTVGVHQVGESLSGATVILHLKILVVTDRDAGHNKQTFSVPSFHSALPSWLLLLHWQLRTWRHFHIGSPTITQFHNSQNNIKYSTLLVRSIYDISCRKMEVCLLPTNICVCCWDDSLLQSAP